MSITRQARLLVLGSLLVAACGDKGASSFPDNDLSVHIAPEDMTVASDFSSQSCTKLSFPNDSASLFALETDDPSPGIDYVDQIGAIIDGSSAGLLDSMLYGYWHPANASEPTLPRVVTLSSSVKLSTCVDCLTINVDATNPDDLDSGTLYLAQGGMLTTKALDHGSSGTISVYATSLDFVEWLESSDTPKPSGGCIDVSGFDWTATYSNGTNGDMQ